MVGIHGESYNGLLFVYLGVTKMLYLCDSFKCFICVSVFFENANVAFFSVTPVVR